LRDLARRWKDKKVLRKLVGRGRKTIRELREWVVNKQVIKMTGEKELKEDNEREDDESDDEVIMTEKAREPVGFVRVYSDFY